LGIILLELKVDEKFDFLTLACWLIMVFKDCCACFNCGFLSRFCDCYRLFPWAPDDEGLALLIGLTEGLPCLTDAVVGRIFITGSIKSSLPGFLEWFYDARFLFAV